MEFCIYSPTEEKPVQINTHIPYLRLCICPFLWDLLVCRVLLSLKNLKKKKKESVFSSASKGAILTYVWIPYTVLDFLKYQCKLIISSCLFSGVVFFEYSVLFFKIIPFHKGSFQTVKGLNNTKCNGKMLPFFFLCNGKPKKCFPGNVFL